MGRVLSYLFFACPAICFLLAAFSSLLSAHSLLITHYSLFITHYSSLITPWLNSEWGDFLNSIGTSYFVFLPQDHLPVGIKANEDKKKNGEGDKGGTSIGNKGKGNPNNRCQAYGHADIDEDVKKENRNNTIGITSAEYTSLSFGNGNDTEKENEVNDQ